MPTFNVVAATKKKDVPAKEGQRPKQVILLTLDGPAVRTLPDAPADEPVSAEWFTDANTPLPAAGSQLDGDITKDPQWGYKFKKAGGGGGWRGGGGNESPERSARIVRQHSQEMGLRLFDILLSNNLVSPPTPDPAIENDTVGRAAFRQIAALASAFDNDVTIAVKKTMAAPASTTNNTGS